MCYDYEFEMLKKAYVEELARRKQRQAEASGKPNTPEVKEAPKVPESKEPVPA